MFGVAILFFCSIFTNCVLAETRLIAVSLLYRHGDRSICGSYPNDPYKNESNWPVPFGELLNAGKQRHYAFGHWLRQRYNNFLSQEYRAKEFRIQSSNFDRCLMSAASNLAGLYPPEDHQVWNDSIRWQPIPIHTLPNELDGMLALGKPCPKFHKLKREYFKSPSYRKIHKKYFSTFQNLSIQTGKSIKNIIDAKDLYDTLFVEELMGFSLPNWTKQFYPNPLYELSVKTFRVDTHSIEMAQLRVGRLLNQVLEQFESFNSGYNNRTKFQVFSAHDSNTFAVLDSLKKPHLELVPYAGAVFFELREKKNGKKVVYTWFKPEEKIKQLAIGNCSKICPYEDFKKIIGKLALTEEEWEKSCNEL